MRALLFHEKTAEFPSDPRVHPIAAIKTNLRRLSTPKKEFDFVLITSPRTVPSLKTWPKARLYVAIGEKTASAMKSCPYPIAVLKESNTQGIFNFFKAKKESSVFFPRSSRGDKGIAQGLRSYGHRVFVRHAYDTQLLNLRGKKALIFHKENRAFLFTSPSTVHALMRSFGRARLRALNLKWVAIGPTTARYIRRNLGISPLIAKSPNLPSMMRALLTSSSKRIKSSRR